jgi:hypothetical protein
LSAYEAAKIPIVTNSYFGDPTEAQRKMAYPTELTQFFTHRLRSGLK